MFQHNAKPGLCLAFADFGEDEKKAFDVIYYEVISLVTVHSKEL